MIKYRTGKFINNPIEAVEVERETDSSVWINGSRNAKHTIYYMYWDTWQEAHEYLMVRVGKKLKSSRRDLERWQGEYENIKGMKAP